MISYRFPEYRNCVCVHAHRSGYPIVRTLICVIFLCVYYEGQTIHIETCSLVELTALIFQQCCTVAEGWLYSDHMHTSLC